MARAKVFCTEVRSWSGTELTSKVLHFDSKGILCKTIGAENAVCGCEIYYLRTVKSWFQMLLCLGRNNFIDKGSSSWWGEIRSASKQVLRHNITWRIDSGPEHCLYSAFVTCNILYSYIFNTLGAWFSFTSGIKVLPVFLCVFFSKWFRPLRSGPLIRLVCRLSGEKRK